jgi:hypothetical protein
MQKKLMIALLAVSAAACTEPKGIELDGTGVVVGVAYIDRDGDGRLNPQIDGSAQGVLAALLLEGTTDTVARATTRADGSFVMPRIEPGRYRLVATRGTFLGDTVEVLRVDSAQFTLAARDTAVRHVRLGYPQFTVAAMQALPVGRRITLEGVALNGWTTFGDSTLHVRDASGHIRAVRVLPSAAQAGDSVRLLGTTGTDNGRPVLAGVLAHVLGPAVGLPAPDSISTAAAATADAGRLADGQARIAGALIRDTATAGNFRRVGVDDGTGRLELLMSRAIAFPPETFSPGAILSASGVLVPASGGSAWQLKPRSAGDVAASFRTVSAADVRTVASGTRVFVHGITLNAWTTFADSTLHVADATGAIRAIRVQPSTVNAGDSIRILGTTGSASSRVVLADASVTVLAPARGLPPIDSVATATAASAANGARADHQVRIAGALIVDTATVAGDYIMGVDDGSGRAEVLLDRHVAFNPGQYVPGGTFAGAGVLVPTSSGNAWRLKPRDRDEAVVSFPTTTVAQARATAAGQQIVLAGLVLSAPATFADSTVHLRDATGTIRGVRSTGPTATFAIGDSVRLLGSTSTRNGQPVLAVTSATVVRAGVGVSEPDSIRTAAAATAVSGARDADFVRVGGTIVGSRTTQLGALILSVDDGSGIVEVHLDPRVTFIAGPYFVGSLVRAAGVLVPTGTGTWQLKPRNAGDIMARHQTATVTQARLMEPGRTVQINAVALNAGVTFTDAAVHITDRHSAIRIVGLPPVGILAGDSVQVLVSTAVQHGQPVLIGLEGFRLRADVGMPAPLTVSTDVAAKAGGGVHDANHVITSGEIKAIEPIVIPQPNDQLIMTGLLLTVDDGSGPLPVVLDTKVGFPIAGYHPAVNQGGPYVVGQIVDLRGLLVPSQTGSGWRLKPRSLQEVTIR